LLIKSGYVIATKYSISDVYVHYFLLKTKSVNSDITDISRGNLPTLALANLQAYSNSWHTPDFEPLT